MRTPIKLLFLAALLPTPALCVRADLIMVTEGVDFSNAGPLGPGTPVGTLDIGVNTISGSLFEIDDDTVAFDLPAGLQIDSIDLHVSNHVDSNLFPTGVSGVFVLPGGSVSSATQGGDGTTDIFTGPLIGPATSLILLAEHAGGIPGASSDWRFDISVSAVPEPSAILSCGLVGMLTCAGYRMKRRIV
ncbi:MAG: hypothetical protein AAGD11_19250 [Planctomycetota bacterium]